MVTVLDGWGDDGAISLYLAQNGLLRCLEKNDSIFDSLGIFYAVLSSTQGGWTPLSSEGRFMGAAAWGDDDRRTNPYYRRCADIFQLAPGGRVLVNRRLANWVRAGERQPYTHELEKIVGQPIPRERMWNPDAVLRVEDIEHSAPVRERVDIAAATQLVFEDALFHVVEHLIRTTGSDRLVLTGGTALNCVATMRLLERFDRAWYRANLGLDTYLHAWVPPIPGDAGAAAGAAYQFALSAGARPGETLEHAFYCGLTPTGAEIRGALEKTAGVGHLALGNLNRPGRLEAVADFAASVMARDGVLGLFQGAAETGPRALGHRSILANPCNPRTLENINRRVKFREAIRPLAPMATAAAARRLFELPPGAADADYNAFSYMVLTARARPEARRGCPPWCIATGRRGCRSCRPEHDPFCHALLVAMGRHVGVEVAVNTSLNVGSPIAQTPGTSAGSTAAGQGHVGLVDDRRGRGSILGLAHFRERPQRCGPAVAGVACTMGRGVGRGRRNRGGPLTAGIVYSSVSFSSSSISSVWAWRCASSTALARSKSLRWTQISA